MSEDKICILGDKTKVNLDFTIDDKETAIIQQVTFSGTFEYPDTEILKRMFYSTDTSRY